MSLKREVRQWVENEFKNEYFNCIDDLLQYGCQSGMVSGLIYYDDTVKFYKRHKREIQSLLQELLADTGLSIGELFGDKWDENDIFAEETSNQNLLAWFGFEKTARIYQDEFEKMMGEK